MKFSEMKYVRPDIKEIKKTFKESINKFNNSKSFEEQDEVIKKINDLRFEFESMLILTYINYSSDTGNKAFVEEQEYFDNNSPIFEDCVSNYYRALITSKFKDAIIYKYGKHFLDIARISVKTLSPDIVDDLRRESRLENEFTKITASADILFNGKKRNLPQLAPYMQSKNRATRKKSYKAFHGFFSKNSGKLDRIFNDLVMTRDRMAKKLGYKNFVGLGYELRLRTDYNSKKISEFRKVIKKYFIPLSVKLRDKQSKRIGVDKLIYYDLGIKFKSGNAKPKGSPGSIVRNARKMYNELSSETSEFFNFMADNELMDLYTRKGKKTGGYCCYLPKYKSPFIFANMNGTIHDIEVLTHEAGHAFQKYIGRDITTFEYLYPTTEIDEIFAHGMEFLTYPWMNLFFKEDAEKFKFTHLTDAVCGIVHTALIDEFDHWIYENPEATPQERKAKWIKLEKVYEPAIDNRDNEFLANGGGWQRIPHLYFKPLYYINYGIAQICAFQLWSTAIHNEEYKDTLKKYINCCKLGGSESFLGLLKEAGLESPFDENVIKKLAREIEEYIDSIDDNSFN